MRASYGVVAKPHRILEANERVGQQVVGLRVNNRSGKSKSEKKWIRRRRRLTGAKLLPSVDDFALIRKVSHSSHEAQRLTFVLLKARGIQILTEKGYHKAI